MGLLVRTPLRNHGHNSTAPGSSRDESKKQETTHSLTVGDPNGRVYGLGGLAK